jgi:hypothetical protein
MATETSESTTEADAEESVGTDSDAEEGFSSFMRSITVTTSATLLGLAAGVLSHVLATAPDDTTGAIILIVAIAVQLPLYKLIGIDTDDFGAKDTLYIAFMTFALWFVSWGILLTAAN